MAKTAVAHLYECCTAYGWGTPRIDETAREGPAHQPIFTFEASILGVLGIAKGRSKQQARQDAAKELLTKLTARHTYAPPDTPPDSSSEMSNPGSPSNPVSGNLMAGHKRPRETQGSFYSDSPPSPPSKSPVSLLHELGQRRCERPDYDMRATSSGFVCTVSLLCKSAVGRGANKQQAKTRAAESWLNDNASQQAEESGSVASDRDIFEEFGLQRVSTAEEARRQLEDAIVFTRLRFNVTEQRQMRNGQFRCSIQLTNVDDKHAATELLIGLGASSSEAATKAFLHSLLFVQQLVEFVHVTRDRNYQKLLRETSFH